MCLQGRQGPHALFGLDSHLRTSTWTNALSHHIIHVWPIQYGRRRINSHHSCMTHPIWPPAYQPSQFAFSTQRTAHVGSITGQRRQALSRNWANISWMSVDGWVQKGLYEMHWILPLYWYELPPQRWPGVCNVRTTSSGRCMISSEIIPWQFVLCVITEQKWCLQNRTVIQSEDDAPLKGACKNWRVRVLPW